MVSNSALLVCIVILLAILVILLAIWKLRSSKGVTLEAQIINEQIYVGNLPYRVCENDIQQYFSRFGSVEGVRIIRNIRTGQSKGYAFVTYNKAMHASEALSAHGEDFYGRSMVVRIAKAKQCSA